MLGEKGGAGYAPFPRRIGVTNITSHTNSKAGVQRRQKQNAPHSTWREQSIPLVPVFFVITAPGIAIVFRLPVFVASLLLLRRTTGNVYFQPSC